jgi:phosphate transport system protein
MDKVEIGQHILSRYNEELERLRSNILEMGGLVESQLQRALQSLAESNSGLASDVVVSEARVNQMEVDIDDECNRILATRAPTASDLRLVVAMIKAITDLERVGDEAHKIANIGLRHAGMDRSAGDGYRVVRHLGREALALLRDSLDVFARLDTQAALVAAKRDRLLDEEYDAIQRQCITFMIEDPRTIRSSIDMLWVARALERVGDHAKNICEYVIYMVDGRDVRHISLQDVEFALQADGAEAQASVQSDRSGGLAQ